MAGHHSAGAHKSNKKQADNLHSSYESRLEKVLCGVDGVLRAVYGDTGEIPDLKHLSDQPEKLKRELTIRLETLAPTASRREVSLAGSLFLARKVLPTPPGLDPLPAYLDKMGRYQTVDVEFCEFVAKELPKLFPVGWDSRYTQYCGMTCPNPSASTEASRKRGGARAELARSFSRVDFVQACRVGGLDIPDNREVRVLDMDGKQRIVTVASCRQWVLGPLHHLLYDRLSDCKWLLRGDATVNSFKEFTRVDGEVFVSGDYEAATDNFNSNHSAFILDVLQSTSSLPQSLWRVAVSSLRGTLDVDGVSYPQIAGQLMGNLLSFPLLCLTNYLAFKFAVGRTVPLRINGDDIVFRATPKEYERWKQVVGRSGLVLSPGKTIVHGRYFSLNSAFFQSHRRRKPSRVPVVRTKAVLGGLTVGDESALKDRCYQAFRGFDYEARRKGRAYMLRYHRKVVRNLTCSLNRGLGIHVGQEFFERDPVLFWQETTFLMKAEAFDKPFVEKIEGAEGLDVAKHWTKVSNSLLGPERVSTYSYLFGDWCVNESWQQNCTKKGQGLEDGSKPCRMLPMPDLKRWARLSKFSSRALWRKIRRRTQSQKGLMEWLAGGKRVRKPPDKSWVPLERAKELVEFLLSMKRGQAIVFSEKQVLGGTGTLEAVTRGEVSRSEAKLRKAINGLARRFAKLTCADVVT
jgi:hypothetical protein